jgi:hypothetical protein
MLAGCVAPAERPAVQAAGYPTLAPTTVTVGGRDYLGSVAEGPAGLVLTPQGAEAVMGASISVYRAGLTNSDGNEAKAAAVAVCAQAAGYYDQQAVGRFVQNGGAEGSWVFDGACV